LQAIDKHSFHDGNPVDEEIKKLITDAVARATREAIDDLEERVALNEAGFEAALALAVATAHTIPPQLRKDIAAEFHGRVEQTLASMLHDARDTTGAQYNRLEALRSDILAILANGGS
jgi:hypothetical protein